MACGAPRSTIEILEDRPPFPNGKENPVASQLASICEEWKMPFGTDTSRLPSAAGLVQDLAQVLCGLAPAGKDIFTPKEAIHRGELLQRTLALTLFLLRFGDGQ